MNKKIKIIELLNRISNGEEVPKKIKYLNRIYKFYKGEKDYISYDEETKWCGQTLLFNIMECYHITELLEAEVEILEDNTEDKKYYNGIELLTGIKNRVIKENTKLFNVNADTTFIYKNGNLYSCYDNKLIGSLLEIVDCDFMVLEDNTQEIEELEYFNIGKAKSTDQTKMIDKINELVRAVNKLRKEQK